MLGAGTNCGAQIVCAFLPLVLLLKVWTQAGKGAEMTPNLECNSAEPSFGVQTDPFGLYVHEEFLDKKNNKTKTEPSSGIQEM